ncbi:MAG: response regulator [Myxococcota bacterium]
MAVVLTVDDSRAVRMMVRKALQGLDVTVLEAENGAQGLEVIRDKQPDLVLLDYNMPEMDGEQMLTELRKDPSVRETQVMMLTTEAMGGTMERLESLGLSEYIIKPFKQPDLMRKVRALVHV